ncbi:uncharacterized protein K452DRAFT_320442, partial [Aplosporella prunicola CBS 121167]
PAPAPSPFTCCSLSSSDCAPFPADSAPGLARHGVTTCAALTATKPNVIALCALHCESSAPNRSRLRFSCPEDDPHLSTPRPPSRPPSPCRRYIVRHAYHALHCALSDVRLLAATYSERLSRPVHSQTRDAAPRSSWFAPHNSPGTSPESSRADRDIGQISPSTVTPRACPLPAA